MRRISILFGLVALLAVSPVAGQEGGEVRWPTDYRILCHLEQERTPVMDGVMQTVSNSLVLAPLPAATLAVAGWAGHNDDMLNNAAVCGVSIAATAAITMGLKYAIDRPRPFKAYAGDLSPQEFPRDPSFPSGHTSVAFATAVSLTLCYPKWYVAVPSFLWASGVGFSRLYRAAHYPSDVLVGALVGSAVAGATYFLFRSGQPAGTSLEADPTKTSTAALPRPLFVIPVRLAF